MELIDELRVRRVRGTAASAAIQLLAGDLAAIPDEHAVDALVVSAFPNSYEPVPGTLFEGLYRRGLDMREVAEHKQEDERAHLGCWLSEPLPTPIVERFRFGRILCFEPRHPDFLRNAGIAEQSLEDSVGFVFRCLNHFIIPGRGHRDFGISTVAMPLLATGNQRVPIEDMLPSLLDAAIFWLEQGLPISHLKIAAFKPAAVAVARSLFGRARSDYEQRLTAMGDAAIAHTGTDWESALSQTVTRDVIRACQSHLRDRLLSEAHEDERPVVQRVLGRIDAKLTVAAQAPQTPDVAVAGEYDVFISYAHRQETEVKALVEALEHHAPNRRIFFDRTSIPAGGQWIKILSDAVQRARTFVALLSPEYTASPVCWDEFQCAKLKEYNTRQSVIRTVRLYSEPNLPPIMGIYSYIDCAEGDLKKLRESAAAIVRTWGE